ncbi:POTE ankyrin domain family member G-like [Asterias rubens]|uniref:POTE ankyrin domain family member G-like n=1 Tax=Asterias rubens TaxID=7604 RepID=UPI0014553196|nr:POTE ankyrin domain family member G-like [Asterias rubens]
MSAKDTLFRRIPSIRDRMRRRGSLGQISGAVAIHDAVAKGKIHLAKFILDAVEGQLLVDSKNAHGKTPLICAVRITEESVRNRAVDMLIGYNASVNLLDNVGRSVLSYSCELHCNAVVRKLVKNNVDPNLEDNIGNTPLMYCAMVNNTTGIEIIARSYRRLGLEVDKVNADGMTPLMEASKNGYLECARLLIHEGKASVSPRDIVRNMTAADWAREAGCTAQEIQALLQITHRPRPCIGKTSAANASQLRMEENMCRNHAGRSRQFTPSLNSVSSLLELSDASGNPTFPEQVQTQKEKKGKHPLSMEELPSKFKELRSRVQHNTSSFPELVTKEKLIASKNGHYFAVENPRHGKPIVSAPQGGAFTKRPKPPSQPRRPHSAAAYALGKLKHRPTKSCDSILVRTSSSMEDLLLLRDFNSPEMHPCAPFSPKVKSNSTSHLYHRIDSSSGSQNSEQWDVICCEDEKLDDLKLHTGDIARRERAISNPIQDENLAFPSNQLRLESNTHLPAISPNHRS